HAGQMVADRTQQYLHERLGQPLDVVAPFEQPDILIQVHLVYSPKWSQEVPQARPQPFQRVDVDLADAVPVVVPGPLPCTWSTPAAAPAPPPCPGSPAARARPISGNPLAPPPSSLLSVTMAQLARHTTAPDVSPSDESRRLTPGETVSGESRCLTPGESRCLRR